MSDPTPHRIDVHHHVLPPFYLNERGDEIRATAVGFPQLFQWTPAQSIEEMDRTGVATSVLSISTPGVWFGDHGEGRDLARRCNEYGAEQVRDHRGRFGLFAALPLPDVEGSLREIAYAFDTLRADGAGLLTSYGNTWLGDSAFAPVFDELNRRRAVVFVHPNVPGCCTATVPGVAQGLIELLFDTTRTIISLLYNGTFSRCPDIRFIFCHGGGTLAQTADRIGNLARNPIAGPRLPNGVEYELKKLYLDVASMTGKRSFNAIRELVGIEKMLFGTDFPFGPIGPIASGIERLGLSDKDRRAVERDNALALLPQLARP
ncbi:MAG: amidohydrolase family protein [Burkholderiales bacterium]